MRLLDTWNEDGMTYLTFDDGFYTWVRELPDDRYQLFKNRSAMFLFTISRQTPDDEFWDNSNMIFEDDDMPQLTTDLAG